MGEPLSGLPAKRFWSGKRVLLTGHTGFKGSWLAIWLARLGAQVAGYALPASTVPSLFELACGPDIITNHIGDIRDGTALRSLIRNFAPEIVLHPAAQALVRPSYDEPLETFSVNGLGVAHILDCVRESRGIRVVVVATTDKVYRNQGRGRLYSEDDPLGGHDPYSASKAAAEIIVASYRDAFLSQRGIAVATARAGNVIGGGDWSKDRLVPDLVRAWQSKTVLHVRRPDAVRPWQHVLEPAAGYLVLAEKMWTDSTLSGAWNFGPQPEEAITVRQVVELARGVFDVAKVDFSSTPDGPYESDWLALDISKAQRLLGIRPRWPLHEAVDRTMQWYLSLRRGADPRSLCEMQISEYESTV
jgi:CDP-glucose 4,6-dehydratase